MSSTTLRLFLLVLAVLWSQPGRSQEAQSAPQARPNAEASSLTPEQAKKALEILQDDKKRAELIETLRVIGKASPSSADPGGPGAKEPAQAIPADNLGLQLLMQASDWLGEVSAQLAGAARAIADFPMVWQWLVQLATDPIARNTLLSTAWKLALVIVCALAAEWLVLRAIGRPMSVVARYVPALNPGQQQDRRQPGDAAQGLDSVQETRRRNFVLAYAWQLLLRLPFVLARLVLELLPVAAFAAVGNMMLATQLGSEAMPRVITVAMVNAYVLCRSILCVTRALVSPTTNQPSLLIIRDETAVYIDIWMKRIVVVAVFGVAFANVALLLGLYFPAYQALVRLAVLVAHLFVVIVTLQCRRNVADLIRAPESARGFVALVRNRLADIWHLIAIALNLALWVVWALRINNGYALVLQYCVATVAVLVIARLISMAVRGGLDRLFRISPEFIQRFPGLEARANRYFPALHSVISGFITVVTVIALLQVWGIDALGFLFNSRIGGRLLSALLTIAIAVAAAFAVWELSNAAIERHLGRLTKEGQYARTARLRTFVPMLRTTLLAVILSVVVLTFLNQVGVNIAPLLAGAGIVGIAIGFGSQKLVQDVITGLFLLLENAVQVGDVVTVSGLTGTVENLSIRTIRLRASDGSVHIVPFSSVDRVTNMNRGIGNASISVNVAYHEDTDRVGTVLKDIAAQMRHDSKFKSLIRGDLDLWGIDKFDAAMVTLVGQIECTPAGRWPVQREFYRRMKRRFQDEGIKIAG
jgi:small-conductance mechanosensitive channel